MLFYFIPIAVLVLAGAGGAWAEESPGCPGVRPYVYKVALYGPGGKSVPPEGFGAGLFLGRDGSFLMARHILAEAPRATRAVVEVAGGSRHSQYSVDRVLASSSELDIAIVRVRLNGARVNIPPLAVSVRVGDQVTGFRVGPPLPAAWSPSANGIYCTEGWVAHVAPHEITIRGEYFFVPGSSGSPVFNAAGQVIAVALEMVDWNPGGRQPDWTFNGLPIGKAIELPRFSEPVPLSEYLARIRRENAGAGI